MKKSHEWMIVVAVGILILGVIGGVFWYLTKDTGSSVVTTVEKSEEQQDLDAIEGELNGIADLDLTALDAIDKDLQAIDLAEL